MPSASSARVNITESYRRVRAARTRRWPRSRDGRLARGRPGHPRASIRFIDYRRQFMETLIRHSCVCSLLLLTGLHAKTPTGEKFFAEGQAEESRKDWDAAATLYSKAL